MHQKLKMWFRYVVKSWSLLYQISNNNNRVYIVAFHLLLASSIDENGQSKKKRHSKDPAKLDFDKDALLQEVNGMADGSTVSLTYAKSSQNSLPTRST